MIDRPLRIGIAVLFSCALNTAGCGPQSGTVLDEAMRAGRTADSLPAADEDYFRDMDRGLSKDPRAVGAALPFLSEADAIAAFVKGRNNWIVWTGGNDRLWDYLANHSFGSLDFLKTLSSHPTQRAKRQNRWYELGLVNEPCFEQATGPNPDRYGLWLDRRIPTPECPPDPFENANRYPGVQIGARGKNIPVGSYYGEASGIVGLRLLPNPDFDQRAQARWDPVRFYEDPTYYQDRDLVRPYRVGMSCAFCHVGPSPINPPADYENPRWENLNSNPGAQYFWWDRIFFWDDRGRERKLPACRRGRSHSQPR